MSSEPLDLYWYWPFARAEELALAEAVPRPGDRLDVHVLDRPGGLGASAHPAVRVHADLPEVDVERARSAAWLADRASTYVGRHRSRQRMLDQLDPDLVHVLFVNRFTDVALVAGRRRAPLVLSVHDVLPHRSRLGRVERLPLRALYAGADHLVVHHRWVADRLRELFPCAPPATVVPLQVTPATVPPVEPADRRPEVLLFGTLRANKGVEVLLEAVDRSTGDWRLRVAGRGDAAVEAAVREAAAGGGRVVAELGWVEPTRKSELLAGAALVALPYTAFESQSGVLHDAYAHGTPVVAADVGALGDEVREHGVGWLVPPSDAAVLARTLDAAMADLDSRAAASRACRIEAERRSPREVGASLRDLYDEVVARGVR